MPDSGDCSGSGSGPNGRAEFKDCGASSPRDDSEIRFRALALAALDQQQADRGKLARLLHDDVAQMLSAAGMQLDILSMDLRETVPGIASRTAEIQELLDHVVKRIRDLSFELNPDIVERVGLQVALDLMVGRFRKSFPGSLRLMYDSAAHIGAAAVAMERIAQEAVSNAIHHARCKQIEIVVTSTREGTILQVRDDGIGFDVEQARACPRGLGLARLDYCAANAGLRLTVGRNDGPGTIVRAVLAHAPEEGGRLGGKI